jgi:1-acyl-sn-glycerol-3-phosphate acyltransferase
LILFSILKLIGIALNTVIVTPIAILMAPIGRHARLSYRLCEAWALADLALCGVHVRTRRLAPLDPRIPYVFMSNHRSHFDPLAVVAALREFQLRWVAKRELTRVPFFGWALRATKHVIIDRSNTTQAVATLRAARAQMLEGISVVIFPEGTRSEGADALLPLKKGGFMLALETGFPIVPIAVRGSRAILPKGSWRIVGGEIEVVVGAPIAVEGAERDELIERVRAFMLEHLDVPVAPGRRVGVAEVA